MKTTLIITIEHSKPIESLCDKVAARAWTIDGVNVGGGSAVTARQLVDQDVERVATLVASPDSRGAEDVARDIIRTLSE